MQYIYLYVDERFLSHVRLSALTVFLIQRLYNSYNFTSVRCYFLFDKFFFFSSIFLISTLFLFLFDIMYLNYLPNFHVLFWQC